MIHEEICTYEVCKLAKERGFDVPTHYAYNENCQKAMYMELCLNRNTKDSRSISAPTQSLLQRWLREEKNIHIEIIATASGYYWCVNKTNGTSITDSDVLNRGTNEGGCFDTYELALEDALVYSLKNLV